MHIYLLLSISGRQSLSLCLSTNLCFDSFLFIVFSCSSKWNIFSLLNSHVKSSFSHPTHPYLFIQPSLTLSSSTAPLPLTSRFSTSIPRFPTINFLSASILFSCVSAAATVWFRGALTFLGSGSSSFLLKSLDISERCRGHFFSGSLKFIRAYWFPGFPCTVCIHGA